MEVQLRHWPFFVGGFFLAILIVASFVVLVLRLVFE